MGAPTASTTISTTILTAVGSTTTLVDEPTESPMGGSRLIGPMLDELCSCTAVVQRPVRHKEETAAAPPSHGGCEDGALRQRAEGAQRVKRVGVSTERSEVEGGRFNLPPAVVVDATVAGVTRRARASSTAVGGIKGLRDSTCPDEVSTP
jgi:hypothetical protein